MSAAGVRRRSREWRIGAFSTAPPDDVRHAELRSSGSAGFGLGHVISLMNDGREGSPPTRGTTVTRSRAFGNARVSNGSACADGRRGGRACLARIWRRGCGSGLCSTHWPFSDVPILASASAGSACPRSATRRSQYRANGQVLGHALAVAAYDAQVELSVDVFAIHRPVQPWVRLLEVLRHAFAMGVVDGGAALLARLALLRTQPARTSSPPFSAPWDMSHPSILAARPTQPSGTVFAALIRSAEGHRRQIGAGRVPRIRLKVSAPD